MSKEHGLTLIHPFCGQLAFHVTHVPEPLERLASDWVQYDDGGPVPDDELLTCASCTALFTPYEAWLSDHANYVPRSPGASPKARDLGRELVEHFGGKKKRGRI